MSAFLYFIPGGAAFTRPEQYTEALARLGLTVRLADTAADARAVVGAGPSGTPGVVFVAHPIGSSSSVKVGYYADEQTWFPIDDGAYWIGYYKNAKPGPQDLVRPVVLYGHPVPLADGNIWSIPAARTADGGVPLPEVYGLDEKGIVSMRVPQEFREFSAQSREFYNAWVAADGKCEVECSKLISLAVEALSLNYRVGMPEVMALEILTTRGFGRRTGIFEIALATIDWPVVQAVFAAREENAKKNENAPTPDISDGNSGIADE